MKKKIVIGFMSFLSLVIFVACGTNNKGTQSSSTSASTFQGSKHKNISSVAKKSTESSSEILKSSTSSQQESTTIVQPSSQQSSTQVNLENNDYYLQIKNAWQKEKDYIDSITDPHVKQGVQSPESAAISESSLLLAQHPEDGATIDAALKKVLSGQ